MDEKRALRDTKSGLDIEKDARPTIIYAVAISKKPDENTEIGIPCDAGEPIDAAGYDVANDICYVWGVDYFHVGSIPCSFYVSTPDSVASGTFISVPEKVFRQYLPEVQNDYLDTWKVVYKKNCHIRYFQILGSYDE